MHHERTAATHSNKNIDMSRTKNNYALWPIDKPDQMVFDTGVEGLSSGRYAAKRLRRRLAEVSCLQRPDVNVLCEWCLHLGVDVPPGYASKRTFYEAAVRVMAAQYGPKNIIYAWVHEDEVNSHIHVGFVPIVKKPLKLRKNASAATKEAYEQAVAEGKAVIERVDANSVITRKHLQGWHGWMRRQLTTQLGYDPGIYTGITAALGGNMTVAQLKNKPEGWTEKRSAAVEAYHNARRAAARGRIASLNDQISVSDPRVKNIQNPAPQTYRSLDSMIGHAREKRGKR